MTRLPPDAVVIRGGVMPDLDRMLEQAEDEHADSGRYRLSTFCGVKAEGESDDEVVERVVREAQLPNGQIRGTRAQVLYDLGFDLVQTGQPQCHYDVDLGENLTAEVIQRFERAFDPPRRNPCR